MGKKAPSPTPPREIAAAQTHSNIHAAISNAYLNAVDQYGPDGNIKTYVKGTRSVYDPGTQKTYEIPQFARRTELSPEQARIKRYNDVTQYNLASLGAEQSKKLADIINQRADFDDLPSIGALSPVNNITFSRIDDVPEMQYNPDSSLAAVHDRIEEKLMERLRPQHERDLERLHARLASQGIRLGSTAYNEALDTHTRSVNDARLAAVLAAGREQKRLHDMRLSDTKLRNALLQKEFDNTLQKARANDQATLQEIRENANHIELQGKMRDRALREKFAISNDPLNRIAALLRGSHVTVPEFVPATMARIPAPDFANIIAQHDANAIRAADVNSGRSFDALDAWMASDPRLKTDIAPVGSTHDGQTVYQFRYFPGGPIHMGLMAPEVALRYPDAVMPVLGLQFVDYDRALAQSRQYIHP